MQKRFFIGNVGISPVNLKSAVEYTVNLISEGKPGYICVTNTRTAFLSNKDSGYCQIQNNSLLTVPDGKPLVWIAHMRGLDLVGKCAGRNFMEAVFEISETNRFSHYFYGCSSNTIELMQKKLVNQYPTLLIKGAISPPFQPLEKFDIDALAREINQLKPTFFWCGLGAPKQEKLIALLQPKLEETICVGVGLAFEYFAGTVKRAPKALESVGLEWLFRSIQQPLKWRRFFMPFCWMIFQLTSAWVKKIPIIK